MLTFGVNNDPIKGLAAWLRPFKIVEDKSKMGLTVPDPIATRRYSGQFKVRIPQEVHRNVAVEAGESDISLNRLVSAKLAQSKGQCALKGDRLWRSVWFPVFARGRK